MRRLARSVPSPVGLGSDVVGVPAGAPVELELRLESVMEGVLVTGTAGAPVHGECVRCLEPIEESLRAEFLQLYAYPEDSRGAAVGPGDAGETGSDDETLTLEGDLFDLEPVLRDAVVLALPLQPVCREDCPGLCPECGARLADDPEHDHERADPRWAALQGLAGLLRGGAGDKYKDSGAPGAGENQEK